MLGLEYRIRFIVLQRVIGILMIFLAILIGFGVFKRNSRLNEIIIFTTYGDTNYNSSFSGWVACASAFLAVYILFFH